MGKKSVRQAGAEAQAVVAQAMKDYHPELVELGVRVTVLFAYAAVDDATGEPKGPAIRFQGYPALAVVKITTLEQRVAGLDDALITFDGEAWEKEWTEPRKLAIADHEIAHLEIVCDDEGNPQYDDANRPRLRMRKHDLQIGAFLDVINRHGPEAEEARQLTEAHKQFMQQMLPFMTDSR